VTLLAADTLLDAVTLTFDLEHLQRIACDVLKLCTKFERNRAIRGRVIAISFLFDFMTLNIACLLRSALGKFLPSLTFDNLSVPRLYSFYDDTLCHAVTLTFDLLNLMHFYSTSGIMRSNSVQNSIELE